MPQITVALKKIYKSEVKNQEEKAIIGIKNKYVGTFLSTGYYSVKTDFIFQDFKTDRRIETNIINVTSIIC